MIRLLLTVILIFTASASYAQEAPNNMHGFEGVSKGAVPGFARKPVYFNAKLAEKQLRYLHDEKGVELIISLDHCQDVKKVISKINKGYDEIALVHICRKIRRSKKHYAKNVKLFEEIASFIGDVNFFIHCRYGAHRAVTALTGAWVSRQNLSFKEAFKRTGGKKRAFRSKGQKALLNQAKKYALSKERVSDCGEEERSDP